MPESAAVTATSGRLWIPIENAWAANSPNATRPVTRARAECQTRNARPPMWLAAPRDARATRRSSSARAPAIRLIGPEY